MADSKINPPEKTNGNVIVLRNHLYYYLKFFGIFSILLLCKSDFNVHIISPSQKDFDFWKSKPIIPGT